MPHPYKGTVPLQIRLPAELEVEIRALLHADWGPELPKGAISDWFIQAARSAILATPTTEKESKDD